MRSFSLLQLLVCAFLLSLIHASSSKKNRNGSPNRVNALKGNTDLTKIVIDDYKGAIPIPEGERNERTSGFRVRVIPEHIRAPEETKNNNASM